ncbi:uncharacterized protein LOC135440277 [Drosophila montana]|uniref:uncharacterized protein LOC135440277 n=1 Tax=Drosophila montana TaxID=40370 RepID=UPI00313CB0D5
MDHHTYAKSGSKKWSVEEKRLLVTKRIEAEDLFSKYSSKQAEPWKKFKDMAKIGDYSERALRKQWLNMVQRYRVQKSNMQATPLNKQCIDVLNEEWEFFGEIHAYMNQKTTDLHSYALKEPNVQEHSHNNNVAIRGVVNDHSFGAAIAAPNSARRQMRSQLQSVEAAVNVELDYALAMPDEPQQQQHEELEKSCEAILIGKQVLKVSNRRYGEGSPSDIYTDSDSEESSQPSDPVAVEVSDLSEAESILGSPLPAKSASDICETTAVEQLTANYESASGSVPLDDRERAKSSSWSGSATLTARPLSSNRKRKALTEREKYYRHRRRYEHRMELRLGGLCKVAGQLLEQLVPGANVTPLLMNIYNTVDYNCNSSCDDDDDDTDEDDIGQP